MATWIKILSKLLLFVFNLFFEIFEIWTEATGAFVEIFFSSLYIFAFSAIKDLFFLSSITSTRGRSALRLSSSATAFVINIL